MKRLTREQSSRKKELIAKLRKQESAVHLAVERYNEQVEALKPIVEKARDAYNEVVQELQSFAEDVVSDMECYSDERSEKWQESDAALKYEDWRFAWEEFCPDELENIDFPDELDSDTLDFPFPDPAETLKELPTAPEK